MTAYLIFTLLVLLILLFPIKKRPIDFDEKAEAIRIYRDEVTHIQQQYDKALIDDTARKQLLFELEKKSAMTWLSIEEKTFAYRSAYVPTLIVLVGLIAGGVLYGHFYSTQGVGAWQTYAVHYQNAVTEGMSSRSVIDKTLINSDKPSRDNYCFLLQQNMLRYYATDADALTNVAECHLQQGYMDLVASAIERALRVNSDHLRANYVLGQLAFINEQRLSPALHQKLAKLVAKSPEFVDILYLLALDSFSQGQFVNSQYYIEQLKPLAGMQAGLHAAIVDLEAKIAHYSASVKPPQATDRKESK